MSVCLRGLLAVAVMCLCSGCLATRPSCDLSEAQGQIVLEKVAAKIAEIEDEAFTYDIDRALRSNQLSQLENGRCYAYLYPVSKEGLDILDGDGGVYVDPETLELGEVFWFAY